MKTPIKDFYGTVLGYLDTKPNGDVVAYDFYNRVLGTYSKQQGLTKDFYGTVIARGDITSALVYSEAQRQKGAGK